MTGKDGYRTQNSPTHAPTRWQEERRRLMNAVKYVPTIKEFEGYQGMFPGEEDGYGRAYVLYSDYAALAASHEKLVDALKAAQEELRLIRMKDSNAVYDPVLRTATIPLALAEAEKISK